MSFESDSSDYSESEDYEICRRGPNFLGYNYSPLPFDPNLIENIILTIIDKFDFRMVLNDNRVKGALLVTAGLTVAGSLIGRHYGGKIGTALGGVVGGACGLGVIAVSMRDVWKDIKPKLSELFDIVYDYLAGMGIEDYKKAAQFLTQQQGGTCQLAMIILETASSLLGKQIMSNLNAA